MNRFVLSVAPMLALLVGCQGQVPDPGAPASAAGPPTLEELQNETFRGFEEPEGPVTLVDGRWEGEPYEEGAASRPSVQLLRELQAQGDLDGDGVDEAVVLLTQSSGGTGTFVHLAVVGRRGEALENLATTPLGDRVQTRGVRVEGGRVLVDVLRAGPDDAQCCPGELATQGFALEANELRPVDTGTSSTRLSLEAIARTEWVLRRWSRDEPAPSQPEVTLRYEDGRFTGRSACNNYSAPAKETADGPGQIQVGPGIGTRMACPDPAGAMEIRFLQQLEGVSGFGFVTGQLALSYSDGESGGVMSFDGREPAESQ